MITGPNYGKSLMRHSGEKQGMAPLDPQTNQQMIAALSSPAFRIYANGFMIAQSMSDVTVVLQTNGATSAILNLSFTSAKTLGLQLQEVVGRFEKETGQSLLTMQQIQEKTSPGGD